VAHDRSIPEQVRLFDMMPTLLDLLRLAAPEAPDGVSLVPLLDPGGELQSLPVIAEASTAQEFLGAPAVRSIRVGGYKLIEGRGEELYDLRRDRGEARNLAPSEQARVAELHHDLEAAWPAGPAGAGGSESAEESPATPPLPQATLLQAAPLLEEGIVALRGNDPARARRALEDARRLVEGRGRPAPPALLALIGAAVRLQGRPSEALRLDEDALGALDGNAAPLLAPLQSEIGACRRLDGELPAALVAYRAAVAARPHDVDDRCALAEVLIETGQAKEAIEELRAGLARAPAQPQLLAVLGRALIAMGEPQAAVGPLLEAVRNAPWLSRPWFDLAQGYEALGRPAEAARTYQYFLTHEPEGENPLRTEAAGRLRALQPG
jgi:tetratricopeptide (TPR) repeat protein